MSRAAPGNHERGKAAPWLHVPTLAGSRDCALATVGGRALVMLFFGTEPDPACADALDWFMARQEYEAAAGGGR